MHVETVAFLVTMLTPQTAVDPRWAVRGMRHLARRELVARGDPWEDDEDDS